VVGLAFAVNRRKRHLHHHRCHRHRHEHHHLSTRLSCKFTTTCLFLNTWYLTSFFFFFVPLHLLSILIPIIAIVFSGSKLTSDAYSRQYTQYEVSVRQGRLKWTVFRR
jgi:hypothetical protein